MRKLSWILLTAVAILGILGSLASVGVAYFAPEREVITGRGLPQLGMEPEVRTAILARRGTAAAYAVAFFTLFLCIVLMPYRRGERWAWHALFLSLLVLDVVISMRKPFLHTNVGVGTASLLLGVGGVALLLDVKRLKRS